MKNLLRNSIFLLFPFILMVFINESFRFSIKERPFVKYGFYTINSDNKILNKCTWNCHNNTTFCKSHHVKYLKKYFSKTDQLYYGVIQLLKKTGNYGLTNIAVLVIAMPFIIFYFLINGLSIRHEIKKMKKNG